MNQAVQAVRRIVKGETRAARGAGDADDHILGPDSNELKDIVSSIIMWTAGATWLSSVLGSLTVLQTVFRSDQLEWLNRLYCWGQVKAAGATWSAWVHPDVDPNTPYMFIQNHVNHLDHVTMYNATPHFKQGLELESHFKYPFYGWFMKQRGTIPVRRGKEGQTPEIMQYMRDEIARGHSILAFPEGHRSRDGRVHEFRKGVFFIARDLGIPIVPVAVTGMQAVMRGGSWHIRPGHHVEVFCEAPVPTAGLTDDEIPALIERVRQPILERVEAWTRRELDRRERRG